MKSSPIDAQLAQPTKRPAAQPPLLTRQQQVNLRAGHPIASVLDAAQQRHLAWRKRLHGAVLPEFNAPSAYLYALHASGAQVLMFPLKTLAPEWYFHCYVVPDMVTFRQHHKTRDQRNFSGCVCPRQQSHQTQGLLADIYLVAQDLTESVVVHEAVHAAGYLSRVVTTLGAKRLANPFVTQTQNLIVCREEIQCRTVEFIVKQTLLALRALQVQCIPLLEAEI